MGIRRNGHTHTNNREKSHSPLSVSGAVGTRSARGPWTPRADVLVEAGQVELRVASPSRKDLEIRAARRKPVFGPSPERALQTSPRLPSVPRGVCGAGAPDLRRRARARPAAARAFGLRMHRVRPQIRSPACPCVCLPARRARSLSSHVSATLFLEAPLHLSQRIPDFSSHNFRKHDVILMSATKTLFRIRHMGRQAFRATSQGVEGSLHCWIAGQRLARTQSFADVGMAQRAVPPRRQYTVVHRPSPAAAIGSDSASASHTTRRGGVAGLQLPELSEYLREHIRGCRDDTCGHMCDISGYKVNTISNMARSRRSP